MAEKLNPNALTPEQVSQVLSQFGEPVPVEWVHADIAEGCPTNEDGTVNIIVYTAWLTREVVRREAGPNSTPPD